VASTESAQGKLEKTPAVNLFMYAHDKKLTGTLRLSEGASSVDVIVENGWPMSVTRVPESLFLWQVLEDEALMARGQGEASFAVAAKKGLRHGEHLVDAGVLSHTALVSALKIQMTRKLATVFTMSDAASFTFQPAEVPFAGERAPLDPFVVAWLGLRQRPPWPHIKQALERLSAVRIQLGPGATPARFGFTGEELNALRLLEQRPMTLAEFSSSRIIGASALQVFVYALLIGKQVTLSAAPSAAITPGTGGKPNQGFEPSPLSSRTPFTSQVTTQGNTQRFGMPTPQTSIDASKTPFAPSVAPVTAQSFRPSSPTSAANSMGPAARFPSTSPAAPPVTFNLAPEDHARALAIQERAGTIEKQNYFQMLDVATNADTDAIGKAYFALAKEWHPDRLQLQLAHVKQDCSRVFSLLSEAHRTLIDPVKRAEHLGLIKQGGATPEAQKQVSGVLEAIGIFQRADAFVKARDWAQAETLARRAVELDPSQADYLALLAWIESQKPEAQSKSATLVNIETLTKAIAMSEKCERAFLYRGYLYKRAENLRAAFRDFETVTELNPRNIEAAREVRLFNMRGRTSGAPPSSQAGNKDSTMLSKFFKK
jgi:curved DNA-binding protein CbpA